MAHSPLQWPYKHRVRFARILLPLDDVKDLNNNEIDHIIAKEFSKKPVSRWLQENEISLIIYKDVDFLAWSDQVIICGNLTDMQYTEYLLRFHGSEQL